MLLIPNSLAQLIKTVEEPIANDDITEEVQTEDEVEEEEAAPSQNTTISDAVVHVHCH